MVKTTQVKYKKAPQAPRRFKSSYMFYSTEKHRLIRQDLAEQGETEKLSTTDVAKLVSQAWKEISDEEREKWEEMARKDKARYEMEKSMYTGPWKVPAKKRSQKDPNAPKRPMSAFLSFSNSKRAYVKEKYPDAGNAEVSRILAQMWKNASSEERKEHVDQEFKLRQDYKLAIAEWRKNSETEIQTARKEREDEAMKAVLEGKPLGDPDHPIYSQHEQFQKDGRMIMQQLQEPGGDPTVDYYGMSYNHHGDQPFHHDYQPTQQTQPPMHATPHYFPPPAQHHYQHYHQPQHSGYYPHYYPDYSAQHPVPPSDGGGGYPFDHSGAGVVYPPPAAMSFPMTNPTAATHGYNPDGAHYDGQQQNHHHYPQDVNSAYEDFPPPHPSSNFHAPHNDAAHHPTAHHHDERSHEKVGSGSGIGHEFAHDEYAAQHQSSSGAPSGTVSSSSPFSPPHSAQHAQDPNKNIGQQYFYGGNYHPPSDYHQ